MVRRGRRSKATTALARAETLQAADPMQAPRIVRLTERFMELHMQLYRDVVETTIELGEILRKGRPLLRGNYLRWLEVLGINPETAANYEALATLADEAPRVVHLWKELGPSKLYRIAKISPRARSRVLDRKRHEELARMSFARFAELTEKDVVKRRKVTADMKLHGLRMKVRSWNRTLGEASAKGAKGKELRAGLKGELKELVRLARGVMKEL